MPVMPRVQRIVLPILRDALPDRVKCGSWLEDVDYRELPLVNVSRTGGVRHNKHPKKLSFPDVELLVISADGLVEAEELYDDALEALYDAVSRQKILPGGFYLHSILETSGPNNLETPFNDSWAIQGVIALGIRPPKSSN
jgi:hypothetical protein